MITRRSDSGSLTKGVLPVCNETDTIILKPENQPDAVPLSGNDCGDFACSSCHIWYF